MVSARLFDDPGPVLRAPLQLRDYQKEAVAAVLTDWQKHDAVLGVAAVGSGKTQIFLSLLLDHALATNGKRGLVLAHRLELVMQPLERIQNFWPEWESRAGIVMAEQDECNRTLTLATVQTLSRPNRLRRVLCHGPIDYVVRDECHHATTVSDMALLADLRKVNPKLKVLGVTATPLRADGDGLAKVYEKVSFRYGIKEMIQQGYLVPFKALGIETAVSLRDVKETDGDFVASQLANVFDCDNVFDLVVQTHLKYAGNRLAIAFTVGVEGAHRLADKFNEAGIKAAAIDGTTPKPERAMILDAFRQGSIRVVANCAVLTEGFDAPATSVVHMIRPTKSDSLYVQCLDMQTEVLTPTGFKGQSQIGTGDLVAGFHSETGEIRWVPATEIVHRALNEDEYMVSLASPTVDIRVTDGHRMLMRHHESLDTTWRFVPAGELLQRHTDYQIPVAGCQAPAFDSEASELSFAECSFIGWFLTDGTIGKANDQISLCQSEKSPFNAAIVDCLNQCGFDFSVLVIKRTHTNFPRASNLVRYTIRRGRPRCPDVGVNRLDPFLDKDFSPLLDDLSAEQLAVMLEAMHQANGHKQNGQSWTRRTYHICTGNRNMAERLQSLCVRRGFRCNLAVHENARKLPQYMLHIKSGSWRIVGGATQADRPHLVESSPASDEMVWCVTNDLGTLVTRRNGKVAIVGNCIGRALRTYPGKNDGALILDYVPLDSRNVILAGDLLGKPRAQKELEEKARQSGLILEGFSFTGQGTGIDGDPDSLVARPLNYMSKSPLRWHYSDGISVLGLGATENVQRMLAILPPTQRRPYRLVVLYRAKGQWTWQNEELGRSEDVEELIDQGERYAAQHGESTIFNRSANWSRAPLSEAQEKVLCRLYPGERERFAFLARGEASQLITFGFARQALVRGRLI